MEAQSHTYLFDAESPADRLLAATLGTCRILLGDVLVRAQDAGGDQIVHGLLRGLGLAQAFLVRWPRRTSRCWLRVGPRLEHQMSRSIRTPRVVRGRVSRCKWFAWFHDLN